MLNYFQGQKFKSKYPQNSTWHNSNFFWKFFSKPSLITNFRVKENSIILKYMLDNKIQQLKTIGVYTSKPKPNNVLIVIQKWERLKKGKELPWFYFQPPLFQFSDLLSQFFIPAKYTSIKIQIIQINNNKKIMIKKINNK